MITITDIANSIPKLTGCVERFIQSWYCPCGKAIGEIVKPKKVKNELVSSYM